ncbi:MAG: hypothetical protein IJ062_02780 [Firmicutes bacterium]|nr:hypothetical protein [Bacillota bacterium]
MEGWIKLHRNLVNWEWYKDANASKVFMHLLLCAVFKPTRWAGTELQPGQYVCTRKKLSEDTGLSESQVRTALAKLSETGEITVGTTKKHTLITIVKYGVYQGEDKFCRQQTANDPTENSQQTANGIITSPKNEVQPETSPTNNQQTAQANPHNDSVCGNDAPKIDQKTANENITSQKTDAAPETSPINSQKTADKTQYFNPNFIYGNPPVYRLKVCNTEKGRPKAANKSPINDQQIANKSPINRQHNKNDKNDKNIKNDKKDKNDIISFEGRSYVYNTSFDHEGLEDEIQDIKCGVFYQLYIQNIGRTGLNRFAKKALLGEPQVMRHLVNRGFFVPAGEI